MHPKLQLYSDAGEFVFFLIFILMSVCQIDWIVHNRFLNLLKLTYFIFWQWKPIQDNHMLLCCQVLIHVP